MKPTASNASLIGESVPHRTQGPRHRRLELPHGRAGARGAALLLAERRQAFFESLLEFITSGRVLAAVVEGPRAIAAWRQLAGGTDPVEKATPGSIRGDFGLETQFNLVHGSDSPESAAREIKLWFPNL